MASDTPRPPSPSWWWVLVGVSGAIALAWVAGTTGGGVTASPPPSVDLTDVGVVASTERDLIGDAETFWKAIGLGDDVAVREMLDPGAGAPLTHYAEFAAGFEAGFHTQGCRTVDTDVIRCLLGANNSDLVALYRAGTGTTAYMASASITFSEGGIEAFQLPALINTASTRMLAHAVDADVIPPGCDRINYDALDLPPFSTSMAQTADCARQLLPFLPGAIAAQVP